MNAISASHRFPVAAHRVLPWLVMGGLTAGTLDLVVATLYWSWGGSEPLRSLRAILQAIASWVLGREQATAGGWTTALSGAVLHFGLMIAMVAGFHTASLRWARLLQRPLLYGALYGALLYALMFLVVVPHFSAVQSPRPLPPSWTVTCFLVYVLLVGIPSALFTRAATR